MNSTIAVPSRRARVWPLGGFAAIAAGATGVVLLASSLASQGGGDSIKGGVTAENRYPLATSMVDTRPALTVQGVIAEHEALLTPHPLATSQVETSPALTVEGMIAEHEAFLTAQSALLR